MAMPEPFTPIVITGGILTNIATDILKHHAQRLEDTLAGRMLKWAGLIEPNFDERLIDALRKALDLYFEQYPEYRLTATASFFQDPNVAREIGGYILDRRPINQDQANRLLVVHFGQDLTTILVKHRGLDATRIIPDFLACYRRALNQQLSMPQMAVLLEILEQTDALVTEIRASEERLMGFTKNLLTQKLSPEALRATYQKSVSLPSSQQLLLSQKRTSVGISSDLYNRLRGVLLDCGPFDSDTQLRAIFVDERISPWRDSLPQANSRTARIEAVVDFMLHKRNSHYGQNGLVLFLQMLSERVDPGDACHQRLINLVDEFQKVLEVDLTLYSEPNNHTEATSFSEDQVERTTVVAASTQINTSTLRLQVFDTVTQQWASRCEFAIPAADPNRKLAYQIGFPLRLENQGPTTAQALVIEMQLTSDTDFFLSYGYNSNPLVIEDSPRDWRISKSYDYCEFEGGASFVCHSKGQRHLGIVQMLVPYGQPDTTMTFHYRIQAEGNDNRSSFAIVLKQNKA